jgi:hypothetical protein
MLISWVESFHGSDGEFRRSDMVIITRKKYEGILQESFVDRNIDMGSGGRSSFSHC